MEPGARTSSLSQGNLDGFRHVLESRLSARCACFQSRCLSCEQTESDETPIMDWAFSPCQQLVNESAQPMVAAHQLARASARNLCDHRLEPLPPPLPPQAANAMTQMGPDHLPSSSGRGVDPGRSPPEAGGESHVWSEYTLREEKTVVSRWVGSPRGDIPSRDAPPSQHVLHHGA